MSLFLLMGASYTIQAQVAITAVPFYKIEPDHVAQQWEIPGGHRR